MIFCYLQYILLFYTLTTIKIVTTRDADFMDGEFSKVTHSVKIENIFKTFERMHLKNCVINCMIYKKCQSINHDSASKQCELSDENTTTSKLITADVTWSHLQKKQIEKEETSCPKSIEPSQTTKKNNTTNETMQNNSDIINTNPSSKDSPTTDSFVSTLIQKEERHSSSSVPTSNSSTTESFVSTLIQKEERHSSSSVPTSSSSTTESFVSTLIQKEERHSSSSVPTSSSSATESFVSTLIQKEERHSSSSVPISSSSTKQTSTSTSTATTMPSTVVKTNSANKLYGINFISKTAEVPLFPMSVIDASALSVCFWIHQVIPDNSVGLFTAVNIPTNKNCNLFLVYLLNKRIKFYKVGAEAFTFTKHPDIVYSHYYHLCFVWESNTITLHIRNSTDSHLSSETITNDGFPGVMEINKIALGQDMDLDPVEEYCVTNDANQCFQGTISNIDVWSRVLTMDEVDRHFGILDAPFGEEINRTTFMNYNETSSIKKSTNAFDKVF